MHLPKHMALESERGSSWTIFLLFRPESKSLETRPSRWISISDRDHWVSNGFALEKRFEKPDKIGIKKSFRLSELEDGSKAWKASVYRHLAPDPDTPVLICHTAGAECTKIYSNVSITSLKNEHTSLAATESTTVVISGREF